MTMYFKAANEGLGVTEAHRTKIEKGQEKYALDYFSKRDNKQYKQVKMKTFNFMAIDGTPITMKVFTDELTANDIYAENPDYKPGELYYFGRISQNDFDYATEMAYDSLVYDNIEAALEMICEYTGKKPIQIMSNTKIK